MSEHCLVLTEGMEDGLSEAKTEQIWCLRLSSSEQTEGSEIRSEQVVPRRAILSVTSWDTEARRP